MSDEEGVYLILMVIAFFFGLLLTLSGFADLGQALNPDFFLLNPLGSLSNGGTGSLKITVGVILMIAVIAPNALKVIFQR